MANIALDIKANTQKALGEFKKLSRELDNKFLVQGLKLDVVKNAFTQINREFENAVGTQGLRAAESSGQLQRSLALNLTTFKRFGRETAEVVSKDVLNSLQQLRAEGTITGKVLQDSLSIASFLDFDAAGPELQRKLREGTNTIAKFVQQTSDLFGGSEGQLIQRALTGEISVDQFFKVSTGQGGATNKFRDVFRKYQDALKNADPTIRTQGILAAIQEIQSDPAYRNTFRSIKPIESVFREISGLFSEKGLFGALRPVGDQIRNFDNQNVDRNLLQVTGKLLRTIFDREEGVFAKLNKALQRAFGNFDVLEPILAGVTFLTEIFEKLGNFFESSEFRSFLNIFDGLVEGLKSIFSGGGLDLSAGSINKFIDGVFEAIRGLINKVAEFIRGLDASAIGSVLGNVLEELVKTLPSLLNVIFSGLGKALQVVFSDGRLLAGAGILGALGLGRGALGVANFIANRTSDGLESGRQGRARGILGVADRRITAGISGFFDRRRELSERGRKAAIDFSSGDISKAQKGGFTGYQGAVIRKFNQIIILLRRGIGVFNIARPAIADQDLPRRPRNPAADRYMGRGSYSGPRRGLDTVTDPRVGDLERQVNRRGRFVPRGRIGRRGIFGRLAGFGGDILAGGLGDFITGGPDFLDYGEPDMDFSDRGGRLRDMSPAARARYNRRFGLRGRMASLGRGIGRIGGRLGGGILGGLTGAAILGSIFGGGRANASEIDADDSLSPEEKELLRKKNRESTRQQAGAAAIGMAGGALGGIIGSFFGPAGTFIGGALGQQLGDAIAGFVSPGILEAVGKFVEDIGAFFGDLWNNVSGLAQGGFKNFMNFFGPEGPIQSLSRFVFELPGNIIDTIKEGFSSAYDGLKDLGGNIVNTLAGLFGGGRFLGGVGSGLTLVGENGPELVNLGSGAIVIPNSSLNGNLYGGGGSPSSVNNYVTVNVNAPGADEFAQQLSDAVIVELNTQFNQISAG
ncbi:virion structural protein and packaging [Cyanophage S-TIM5]|uniref:Virion structural protein and packaging n=1 Tax=Cyanophage S-TIM5 TaxID=1137745 RepID=H6WG15_9CAUD|nr:virion structural protein and packaging [Cyanophage S-TIM5]AEZ65739.1 virion structural protein and packaging [Cyanophage S-TIM5]UYE96910.1 virion structural protein [Cyanophage S-TIM66]